MFSIKKIHCVLIGFGLLCSSPSTFAVFNLINNNYFSHNTLINHPLFVNTLRTISKRLTGTNPIGYSTTPTSGLPSTTYVNNSYSVHYTLTNNLPFSETLGTIAKNTSGIGFTVEDQCSGQTLSGNGDTCGVDVLYHPQDTGNHSIQLTIAYDKNRVPLPALSTTTQTNNTDEISGGVTDPLPASTIVQTGYNVEFSFTNLGKTDSITASNITYTGDSSHLSSVVNNCNSALSPSDTCTITGTYTPNSAGSTSVGVTYKYDNNTKSVALSTHTIASGGPTSCASVAGSTPLMLPINTYLYGDNVVKFQFKNNCDTASATLGNVSLNAALGSSSLSSKNQRSPVRQDVSNWITTGTDTCSGATLSPKQTCSIEAAIMPTSTGTNLHVTADVNYTESSQTKNAEATTSSNEVQANTTNSRTITVINQCNFPVWTSFVAAAAPGVPTPSCANGQACPTGTQCDTANNLCYFSNPTVSNDGELQKDQNNAAPHTMDVTVPENNAGSSPLLNIIYNASIVARRGCSGTGSNLFCTENNCGGTITPTAGSTDSEGQCAPGTGVNTTPGISYNGVEFTFLKNYNSGATSDGDYDEQTINGVNVPMEIKGRGPATSGTAPYSNCQPAGAIIQKTTGSPQTQLGNCTYSYTTPTSTPSGATARPSNYQFVTPVGDTDCESSDSLCTVSGEVCGLAYINFGGSTGYKLTKRCGTLQGYVSVNTGLCSQNSAIFHAGTMQDLQTLYNCSTKYPSPSNFLFTGAELFACSGTYTGQSCYNPNKANPSTSCCGCVNWWDEGITVPTNTQTCTTDGTTYSNPNWTNPDGIVQSQVQWMKQSCPTAYSFQYDDPSSSFQCTVANQGNIVTNYQVTLCPGGKSLG